MKKTWTGPGTAAALGFFLLSVPASVSVRAHGGEDHSAEAKAKAGATAPGGTQAAASSSATVPESQFELEIIDTAANDPLLGNELPLENAAVTATVKRGDATVLQESAHVEGEGTGIYGVHAVLDENGAYQMRWEVAPKDGKAFTVDFPLQVAGAPVQAAPASFLSGWRLPAAIAGAIALLSLVFVLGRASGKGNKGQRATNATTALLVAGTLILSGLRSPLWAHGGEDHSADAKEKGATKAAAGPVVNLKVGIGDLATETQTKTVGRYKATLTVKVIQPEVPDPNVVRLTQAQAKTIGIQTVPVSGGRFDTGLSVTGSVQADPSREVTL